MEKKAIIIGAGPAGLTAAYELLKRTDIKPIILEKSGDIGGISKTVNYKGNRIDIGGHRFFSKSDRVMNWWLNIMPIQAEGQTTFNISYQNKSREIDTASLRSIDNAGKDPDKVMLVRRRLSRIYFLRKFFTYPIQLSLDTLTKLGLWTTIAIMFSYLKAQLLPRKPEKNLEDFMINRFGQVLYKLFFKDYTEKVWGIPCDKISAEWGAQRIKGVSISKAIQHAIQSATKKKQKLAGNDIAQKDTETSLIEQFLYPKFGPGQLWEEVARQVERMGGKILMHHDVKRIYTSDSNNQVTAVAAINNITGETSYLEGDYFFSTMPVQELIGGLDGPIPEDVKEVAAGLQYRDFITVGILLKKLSFQDKKTGEWRPLDLKDTWIYIQEKDVKVGRLQLFNNWSPYMVKDPNTAWVGMEFFCNKTDDFWGRSDEYIKDLAIRELEKIGLACQANVLDATVLRMEKTYPAYFGTYERFDLVREYVDRFENLFLVGRNGMHKYNNSDHSMLTAMVAVDNITEEKIDKSNIWNVNTDQEYLEVKIYRKSENKDVIERNRVGESAKEPSLVAFIRDGKHRNFLYLIAIAIVLLYVVMKIEYPIMNFIPDSYSYLGAAFWNNDLNVWPIGYSKFLRIFSTFSDSQIVLSSIQFVFLEASILYFAFSAAYVLKLNKLISYGLIILLTLNPTVFIISNIVSADSIFIALSAIWFSQMVWLYYKPTTNLLILHTLVLVTLFTFRYNALYYPILTVAAITFSPVKMGKKLIGIATCILLVGVFVTYNRSKFSKEIGHAQFAPFSGWQLASNALFMYSRIETDDNNVPSKFRTLHNLVNQHIDSLHKLKQRPDSLLGVYYLWKGPLNEYLNQRIGKSADSSFFKRWSEMAPLYSDYGRFLITRHPIQYVEYFLLPNLINYFVPPTEFMGSLNLKQNNGDQVAQRMLNTKNLDPRKEKIRIQIAGILPVVNFLLHLATLLSVVGLFYLKLNTGNRGVTFFLGLALAGATLNLFFSVLASPIVLRYQIFNQLMELAIIIPVGNLIALKIKKEQSDIIHLKTLKSVKNEAAII